MTISINWATGVITVPKIDMVLIQPAPEIRQLDLDTFRLILRDLEDSPDGMAFLRTHKHNTEVTLGGVTYARLIEIINGYTVTFEDDQYAVNLIGANSNVGDVVNVNQVSVRSANSTGLVVTNIGSGLSTTEQAQLKELWQMRGLDVTAPVTVTTAEETSGSIGMDITGDGITTSTLTRRP